MKAAKDQMGGLPYFDGPGFSRGSDKFSHNQWSGHSNDGRLVNKGRGPTKGNDGSCGHVSTPASTVTKDPYRAAPTSAMPAMQQGKDMFTGRSQVRTPGGTRAWDPQKGQNYKGNPDRINVSGYDMGDGKMSKGSRPVAPGSTEGINYGPKKQY